MAQPAAHPRFKGKPYLPFLGSLENAFPALKSFLEQLAKEYELGREAVKSHYQTKQTGVCECHITKIHLSKISLLRVTHIYTPLLADFRLNGVFLLNLHVLPNMYSTMNCSVVHRFS
jgi:hypothetical protein